MYFQFPKHPNFNCIYYHYASSKTPRAARFSLGKKVVLGVQDLFAFAFTSLFTPTTILSLSLYSQEIYSTSLQLFERARQLAANGECERELLEGESRKLEVAVHMFAAVLDERRDLLVQACTFYCSHQMVRTDGQRDFCDLLLMAGWGWGWGYRVLYMEV